jgi:hypothetical protein
MAARALTPAFTPARNYPPSRAGKGLMALTPARGHSDDQNTLVDLRGGVCYNDTNHKRNAPAQLPTAGGVSQRSDRPMTTSSISPENPQLKRCSKCGEWKSSADFTRNKSTPDGLQYYCRSCRKAGRDSHEFLALQFDAEKTRHCKYCDQTKPIAQFDKRSMGHCKECSIRKSHERYIERCGGLLCKYPQPSPEQRKAIYKEKHRDRSREVNRIRMREWHKTPAGLAARKRYTDKNREAIRERTREQSRESYQTTEGRSARKARNLSREARKRGLNDAFTAKDLQIMFEAFGGCCAACGRPPGLWHTIAADHWIPLISPDCPGTVPHNMVPLCHGVGGCNNIKNDKPAAKWLAEQFGKRKGKAIQRRIEAFLESRKPTS